MHFDQMTLREVSELRSQMAKFQAEQKANS